MDISQEPAHIHELYGTEPGKVSFANNCLLARRLVERGVRFVQLYHWGWDTHGTSPGDDIIHSLARALPANRSSQSPHWCKTSSSAGCWTARWSSGAANSAARR